jgi:hypothetical protein
MDRIAFNRYRKALAGANFSGVPAWRSRGGACSTLHARSAWLDPSSHWRMNQI